MTCVFAVSSAGGRGRVPGHHHRGPDQLPCVYHQGDVSKSAADIITLARKKGRQPSTWDSAGCEEGVCPAGSGSLVELLPRTDLLPAVPSLSSVGQVERSWTVGRCQMGGWF